MDLDIKTYPFVLKRINYQGQYCGMDTPGESKGSSRDFWEYPVQDFDYQFNSWGFRGEDFEQYIGEKVNICLGDSMAVNIGGPVEHSWPSQLAEHFDIPTLNFGMEAAGNDAIFKVYQSAIRFFDVQNTFVMYSFLHRRLINGKFEHSAYILDHKEDFAYFLEHRIPNAVECALPKINWLDSERVFLQNLKNIFLQNLKIYLSDSSGTNRDGQHMNYDANKIYADYLYQQWRQENES